MDKGALSEVLTRSAPVSYPKEKACNFITDTQRLLMSVMLHFNPESLGFHGDSAENTRNGQSETPPDGVSGARTDQERPQCHQTA